MLSPRQEGHVKNWKLPHPGRNALMRKCPCPSSFKPQLVHTPASSDEWIWFLHINKRFINLNEIRRSKDKSQDVKLEAPTCLTSPWLVF